MIPSYDQDYLIDFDPEPPKTCTESCSDILIECISECIDKILCCIKSSET